MLKPSPKFYHHAAWGVLTLLLILIFCTFRDYGITWDEELQSQYGIAIVDYYASFFKDQRYAEIFNLYLYGGTFDGLASFIDGFTPFSLYETRHLLNALFGLLGLWGVWRLGRVMGGGAVGLMALILCAATPMYYGHMFNNPKDIPFAAGIVWTIYFMIRSYSEPKKSVLLKLGVVLGLTLGVRVGGVMVFAFWLAPMGIGLLLPLGRDHGAETLRAVAVEIWRCAGRVVLPVAGIAYLVMLVCWPWAQQHPMVNPLRALSEFSNFPQDVEVLLDGTTYRSTQLPWYYVPLYFGIQLPILLLILGAGVFVFLPALTRSLTRAQKQGLALLMLMAAFPVLYAILRRPALYDTVRHFLFVVPLVSVLGALAIKTGFSWVIIARCPDSRRQILIVSLLSACLGGVLLSQVVRMVQLHPYEYIFANSLVGGVPGAFGRYETDYWASSFKEAAQQIQALVAKEGGVPQGKIYKIAICGPWAAAMIYLPPDYEPVIANEPAEFFLSTTRWQCQNMRPGKEVIRIQRLGVPLSIVKDLRDGFEYYEGNEKEQKKSP